MQVCTDLNETEDGRTEEHDLVIRVARDEQHPLAPRQLLTQLPALHAVQAQVHCHRIHYLTNTKNVVRQSISV